MKKWCYPRENIDDRQENTIPLPFVFKVRCTRLTYRILQTNGSGIVFSCLSSMFSRGQLNFFTLAFIAFCDQTLHMSAYSIIKLSWGAYSDITSDYCLQEQCDHEANFPPMGEDIYRSFGLESFRFVLFVQGLPSYFVLDFRQNIVSRICVITSIT